MQSDDVFCIFSFGYFPGARVRFCRRFGTSAKLNLTPGKYPKENIQDSEHGKNLKSRMMTYS
jgi:hypothetical protein